MILNIGKSFNDYYVIEQKVSSDNCTYREVYTATSTDHEMPKVFLTVYSVKDMPNCMNHDEIQEFEISKRLSNPKFLTFIASGREEYNGETIAWMATKYVQYIKLSELIGLNSLYEDAILDVFCDILIGMKSLSVLTNKGGHYNLTPDTILIAKKANCVERDVQAYIVGLEHAAFSCTGSPNFDVKTINPLYRAKETYLGRFSEASDVYSLGMLLAYLLHRGYPFEVKAEMNGLELCKYIAKQELNINAPEKLKTIIQKAISQNVGNRYKSIDELLNAIMKYRGFDQFDTSDCLSDDSKTKLDDAGKNIIHNSSVDNDNAKQTQPQQPHVNVSMEVREGYGFKAVAGMDALKQRLRRDFVDIVSNKELAKQFVIESSSMILYGPPGTGKTYIAMRLAEECGMESSIINPSDLGSIYIHGSQSMIKELFEKAKKKGEKNGKGVLLILDEFDALCPQRTPDDNNNQSGEVAEFLVQLNNCSERKVFVIGTTNCIDRIDKAVMRKGRIDNIIYIGMPDENCREQLFEYELKNRPHEESIDIKALAKMTEGYTSSDISFLVKESARNSFEASLKTEDKHIVKINQETLESVIRNTQPSVSTDEVRHYEKLRDEFENKRKYNRPRVGFSV
jgi:transitional endoplasmic reticulum ATPase